MRENDINFPTITICFDDDNKIDLKKVLIKCSFNTIPCDFNEFETQSIRSIFNDIKYCYIYNNGRNSSGHSVEIKMSNSINHLEGLKLSFYLKNAKQRIFYHLGEPNENHSYKEIKSSIDARHKRYLIIEKLVEVKLERPYNPCDSDRTIKQSLDLKIKNKMRADVYTQLVCYDACMNIYIEQNCNCSLVDRIFVNYTECYNCFKNEHRLFNFTKRCSNLCPLECNKTYYDVRKEGVSDENSGYSNDELSDMRDWLLKMDNITKITDYQIQSKVAFMNFFFMDLKFTKITQIPKMIGSDIISNIGGKYQKF